tara:strand:+ start:69 stop:251 length:183 start_codon:yes stop_codon:yes gene_type:complete
VDDSLAGHVTGQGLDELEAILAEKDHHEQSSNGDQTCGIAFGDRAIDRKLQEVGLHKLKA